MYYKPNTDQVFINHSDIRATLWTDARTLFADVITDVDLASVGVFPLAYQAPHVQAGQVAEPEVVDLIDGVWTQQWSVRDATEVEQAARLNAIEQARVEKNAEIDDWRAAANASTFPYSGKLIACDALSRSDIDGVANHIALFNAFPSGFVGAWKVTDNTMLPLSDIDAFRAMYAAMTAQGAKNFNRSQELKAQLAAASTLEEIAAITW